MDATALGQTALTGWREKVAGGVARPVSARTPFGDEQVRALVGALGNCVGRAALALLGRLPRPPTFQLELECEAQKRSDRHDDCEHADASKAWLDSHGADDVCRHEEFEPEQDRPSDILAVLPKGFERRRVLEQPVAEEQGRGDEAERYYANAGPVDGFAHRFDVVLEIQGSAATHPGDQPGHRR